MVPGIGSKRMLSRSSVRACSVMSTLCDPMDYIAPQAPLSMEFSRQEYWSRLPFPSPGDLLEPRIKPATPVSPILAGRFFTTAFTLLGSPSRIYLRHLNIRFNFVR